ncbi:RNA-directed DNA polymerase [Tanacetum coccineum]
MYPNLKIVAIAVRTISGSVVMDSILIDKFYFFRGRKPVSKDHGLCEVNRLKQSRIRIVWFAGTSREVHRVRMGNVKIYAEEKVSTPLHKDHTVVKCRERRISWVHEENLRLKQQQDRGNDQRAKEFEQKIKEARKEERRILEDKITQLEEKIRKYEEERFKREFPPLGGNPIMLLALEELTAEPQIKSHVANVVLETEVVRNTAEDQHVAKPKIRKVVNHLYNVTVEFDIPNCPFFKTKAIIDTGASSCFINKEVVPKEALELLTYSINVNGLNSKQPAEHKVKAGTFAIEGNKFRIPLIYAFDMKINDGIQVLIGTNFIRAMQGGIRIEGDAITIYKKVTKFKTTNQAKITQVAIEELEMVSEGEGEFQAGVVIRKEEFMFMVYEEDYEDESDEEEVAFMVRPIFDTPMVTYFWGNNEAIEELRRTTGSWRPHKELPEKSKSYTHDWKENPVTWYNVCYFCGIATTERSRLHCPTCYLTACANYANYYLKIKMVINKVKTEVKSIQATGTSGDGTIMGMLKAKDDEIKLYWGKLNSKKDILPETAKVKMEILLVSDKAVNIASSEEKENFQAGVSKLEMRKVSCLLVYEKTMKMKVMRKKWPLWQLKNLEEQPEVGGPIKSYWKKVRIVLMNGRKTQLHGIMCAISVELQLQKKDKKIKCLWLIHYREAQNLLLGFLKFQINQDIQG